MIPFGHGYPISGLQWTIIGVTIVSCLCSMSVIATYFVFHEYRRSRFMKFIFYMSFCDFMLGIITLFGFPAAGSFLCYAQGILCIYFSMCSWFWTTALSYLTYSMLAANQTYDDMYFHIVCWLVPLALAFLPFTTSTYGSAPDQWCLIVDRANSPPKASVIWSYAAYFCWLFICCGLMIYWTIAAKLAASNNVKSQHMTAIVRRTYEKVALYPYALFISWMLNYICIDTEISSDHSVSAASMICGICYGIVSSMIFFLKSNEARRKWLLVFIPSVVTSNSFECDEYDDGYDKTTQISVHPRESFNETFLGGGFFDPNHSTSTTPSMFKVELRDTSFINRSTVGPSIPDSTPTTNPIVSTLSQILEDGNVSRGNSVELK